MNFRTGSNLAPAPVSLFIVISGSLVNPNPPFTTFAHQQSNHLESSIQLPLDLFFVSVSLVASPGKVSPAEATDPPPTDAVSLSSYPKPVFSTTTAI